MCQLLIIAIDTDEYPYTSQNSDTFNRFLV